MKKFIYFLQDSPTHPFEINAISKAEVKSLIMESVPDESHILAIYTAEEFNQKYNKQKPSVNNVINEEEDKDYNSNFSNSSDFFNSILNSVESKQNNIENYEVQHKTENIEIKQEISQNTESHSLKNDVIYFEDEGISFKLENGKLYRKRWININDVPNKIEYRILRSKTKKECDKDLFEIELLDWVEFHQK